MGAPIGSSRLSIPSAPALGAAAQSTAACVDTGESPAIWDIAGNEQDCNAVYLY